jgi:hypothetical protein
MVVANADSSLKGKSSDDLEKMIEEQTSKVAETAEAVETPEEEVEVSTEEETPAEQPPEEKPAETKEALYKIKVDGKEEEVPLSKVIEYAQKGRYLEKERAKDKAERQKFNEERQQITQPPDWNKLNEQFVDMLQKDPLGALTTLYEVKKKDEIRAEAEERRAERLFESEKEDVPYWKNIKGIYQEFRDLGNNREEAYLKAENEYLKSTLTSTREKTEQEVKTKLDNKEKAKIPLGKEKVTTKPGMLPTPEELAKMPSDEIAKFLKYNKTPGW